MTLDFVKFMVDHENNENWHPTEVTRYTVIHLQYMQGFIQDFKLGGGETVTRASVKHGILGGSGGMPPH